VIVKVNLEWELKLVETPKESDHKKGGYIVLYNRTVMQRMYEKCNSQMWPGFSRFESYPFVSSFVTAAEPLDL
jgi:hypothetical protein